MKSAFVAKMVRYGFTNVYRGLQGFSWVYRGLQGLRRPGTPESRIFSGYYVVHANSSFTLQAITYLRFGLFCIFFFKIWGYIVGGGVKSFSRRISEIYGNRKC